MDFYSASVLLGLCFATLSFGIFISLRIFNIPDITTDGSFVLGGAVSAVLLTHHIHPLVVLPVAMLCGGVAGAVTGWIHTRLGVNPLLAGILVMTGLYSVNLGIMGRSNIPLLPYENIFSAFSSGSDLFFGRLVVLIPVVLLFYILIERLLKTDFGIAMRATGNCESMVRSMGVNTHRMKITGLALANSLTALSGSILVQHQGFADINMGIGIVISGLASVIIGESFLRLFKLQGISFQLLFVLAGTIIFRIALAVALDSGINPNYLKLITALIVLVIISLTQMMKNKADD